MVFGKLFRRNSFPDSKHIIKYAFTCGGIDYYQFEDVFNLPYKRALQSLIYYREVSINADVQFLKQHVQAVKNCLTPKSKGGIIDLQSVFTLNEQLSQRLQLPPDTEILYKLASVVYFDKNEKPETYEFDYGAKKIEHWKKHSLVKDFFLQQPILELLPFLRESGENLQTFQQINQKIKSKHLEKVLAKLSSEQKMQLKAKYLSHPAETPQS
jgi:hypothetical protein